jgi:predicted metal-dependent hydrolase
MNPIPIDQLIRSRRRSISLMITKEAKLIVRAPHAVTDSYIQQVIQQKSAWIVQKQEYFRRKPQAVAKNFLEGEEFLFLGKSYPLKIVDDLPKAVLLEDTLKISAMVLGNARQHIYGWYKSQALEYISQRVSQLAQANGLVYQHVGVNDAQTRWGSCGYKGTLNFSWRLIMAPPRVIDYVVIHELMHLKQRNHSRLFWQEVKKCIPDYKSDEHWLSQNNNLLTL